MIIRIIANRVIICDILAARWQVIVNGANRDRLQQIYKALQEKGYRSVKQVVGYILTEDPTYTR